MSSCRPLTDLVIDLSVWIMLVPVRILCMLRRPFRMMLPVGLEKPVTPFVVPPILLARVTSPLTGMLLTTLFVSSSIFLRNGQANADTYVGPGPLLTA